MKIKVSRRSWLAAILVSFGVIIAGCVQSGTSLPSYVKMVDGVQVVTINANEFAFTPAEIRLNPGKAKFILINDGVVEHEFEVYETANRQKIMDAMNANDEKTVDSLVIARTKSVSSKQTKETDVIELKGGTYE